MPKVLVIDDDVDILDMVKTVLASYDMKVDCANEGSKLWAMVAKHEPDVILMDIYLGDSDGRELCQHLKRSDKFSHIPVILYSAGNISPHSINESLADDFIVKPFDIGVLAGKINAMVA